MCIDANLCIQIIQICIQDVQICSASFEIYEIGALLHCPAYAHLGDVQVREFGEPDAPLVVVVHGLRTASCTPRQLHNSTAGGLRSQLCNQLRSQA